MTFHGIDPHELRRLAGHLDGDLAATLRRVANRTYDTLRLHRAEAVADSIGGDLHRSARTLDDAAVDLRRRAGAIDAAQTLWSWGAALPLSYREDVTARGRAAIEAGFTLDFDAAYDAWLTDRSSALAGAIVRDIGAMFGDEWVDDADYEDLRTVIARIRGEIGRPWFDDAMAGVFEALGPTGAAVVMHELFTEPPGTEISEDVVVLAQAFAAATRGGLGWQPDEIRLWFDHGATGAAQYLRSGVIDRDFLRTVVDTVGLGWHDYSYPEPWPSTRFVLSGSLDLWLWVGPDEADHRAVLLDALGRDLPLAIEVLSRPGVVEQLIDMDGGWYLDDGRALGRLLATVATTGPRTDPVRAEAITLRVILEVGAGDVAVPHGLRPALATIGALHIGDIAHALATNRRGVQQDTHRPGLELSGDGVRTYLRTIAGDDAAFSILMAGYGAHVHGIVGGTLPEYGITRDLDDPDEYQAYLRSHVDELGALTFALAYVDRDVRLDRAADTESSRLSALGVIQFLTSTAVSAIPGAGVVLEAGSRFTVDQIFSAIEDSLPDETAEALERNTDWTERTLDNLEYLLAIHLHRHGLLDGDISIDPADRSRFLDLVESLDGELEGLMAIIESQARRQRELVAAQ